jgi:hypothetical protein
MKTIETLQHYSDFIMACIMRQSLGGRDVKLHVNALTRILLFLDACAHNDHGLMADSELAATYDKIRSTVVNNSDKASSQLIEQFLSELISVYKAAAPELSDAAKRNFALTICRFVNDKMQPALVKEKLEGLLEVELKEFTDQHLVPYMREHSGEEDISHMLMHMDDDKNNTILSDEDANNLTDTFSRLQNAVRDRSGEHQDLEQQFSSDTLEQSDAEQLLPQHPNR